MQSKLKEFKQEIETLYWTFTEEKKSLNLQISHLSTDSRRSKDDYEDRLERLRADLTLTYEQLLANKDKFYQDKDTSHHQTTQLLESHIAHLKTENNKLSLDIESLHMSHNHIETCLTDRLEQIKNLHNEKTNLATTIINLENTYKHQTEVMTSECSQWQSKYQHLELQLKQVCLSVVCLYIY